MKEFLVVEAGELAPQRLRRMALDLADEAIEKIDRVTGDDPKAVHDVRRRLKELRALTSLLGRALPDRGKTERNFFRDAGRELAESRNAKAVLETFDRLRERFADEWTPRRYQKIRRALAQRAGSPIESHVAARLRQELMIERGHIAAWAVDEMRREELWNAVTRSYRRARRRMRSALVERTAEARHEWRKGVKTHWYYAQFLSAVNLGGLEPQVELLRRLSRTLGEHHDLVLLDDICHQTPELLGSQRYVRSFQRFATRRSAELLEEAERAGRDLFNEKPRAWVERVRQGPANARVRIGPKKSPQRTPTDTAIFA